MQNNSECCNNNCNQGRNCPLRAATPAADMGNPVSQLNQHVAAQAVLPEPVLYVSKEQLDSHTNHANSEAGLYLPCRITPAGKFTTPLFAAPQQADACDADSAALFKAQQDFLNWNRAQQTPPVKIAQEYGVFNNAIDLYRAAIAAAKEQS